MLEVDALVVGAGPAGATAALNLGPLRRVLVIERRPDTPPRIGESLPPAVRRLFADMGLWESFLAEEHAPCHGNRAAWGMEEPVVTDFLRDPDGPGWHLDRRRFDGWLRRAAIARGAALLAPASLGALERDGPRWRALLETAEGPRPLAARLVIDAGGRAAPAARLLGARARAEDKLVAGWLHGHDRREGSRMTYVEAVEDGWWYTAPLPGGRRVLAFHTDADLPAARVAGDREALLGRAEAPRGLAAELGDAGFVPDTELGFTAANSATLTPCAGPGWLSAGDAALRFDPLSSQGLFNALFTGLAAAEAADRALGGDAGAMPGYAGTIQGIRDAYRRHLSLYYGAEARWPAAPFWQRRRS